MLREKVKPNQRVIKLNRGDNMTISKNKAISILENMIEELVAIQEPHEKIDGNYSEVEDKIETLREAICRIEKEEE